MGKIRLRLIPGLRPACFAAMAVALASVGAAATLPVFPGAVGFGTDTVAGRGGAILRVTTLDDSGPGSLREAVEETKGPRVVVFDVSGVVRLKSDLIVRPGHGFLTIAGQTAPAPGVTLAQGGISIRSSEVLIQHLAIRPGDRLQPVENRDCIKLEPTPEEDVHHVVVDHVSASWAVDETVSTWGSRGEVRDVTFARCIFSEPIINGGHPKGSHPYGVLGGRNTTNLTLVENVLAFALGRNPLIRDRTGGAQVINNFIYRPGVWSNSVIYIGDLTLPPHAVTVVGNVVIRHPLPMQLDQTDENGVRKMHAYSLSDYRNTGIYVHQATSPKAGLFLADNRFFDPHTQVWHPRDGDPWNSEILRDNPSHPVARLTADPYANSGGSDWRPRPSGEVESLLLAEAGKLPTKRDAIDQGLSEKIATRTGSFRTELAAGDEDPWTAVDIRRERKLLLPDDPGGDADGDGYTNLEEWLHALARGVEIDGRAWLATELAHETFGDDWSSRWTVEGNAVTAAHDGRLSAVTSATAGAEPAATLWWHERLPQNTMIEFTAGADLPAENNAANLNVIAHASERDGSPYRPGRSGRYSEYHDVPNYIFTLTGGFQEGWARVRRNPGFSILAENRGIRSEPGNIYRVRIAIADGRILYWLNGRLVHDTRDTEPLSGGRFALRTWTSRVWWSDLRIFSLSPTAESP